MAGERKRKEPPLPRQSFVVMLRDIGGWSPQCAWTHKGHAVQESDRLRDLGMRTQIVRMRRGR